MPIYEYECSKCRYYAEVMQKITDQPLKKCPSCGKTTFKKLLSAPVFRLKGSGWYETDFKSDKENKRNLAASDKEEASSQSKSESKTESKTETTAAAGGDGEGEGGTVGLDHPATEAPRGGVEALRIGEDHLQTAGGDLLLEIGGGALGDHPTVVDHHDAIGEAVGLLELLGGHQHRRPGGGELLDDRPHRPPAYRVQAGGGLVEEEHLGPADQPCRKVQAPAHAAGVAGDPAVGSIGEPEHL